MNHSPDDLSSTKTFKLNIPQCFVGCFHTHADSFTGDELQPVISYQIRLGIRSLYFILALIALHDVCYCSSVTALLLAPVNSLARIVHKAIATTFHKRIVDTGNCETRRFVILTERGTCAKENHQRESFTVAFKQGGLESLPLLSTR
jgi:hypothetical protein